MNDQYIKNQLQDIFRDIFDEDILLINNSTNAEDIEDWDSLNNINLISAIEKHFKVSFALGEISDLENVGEMINLINSKII